MCERGGQSRREQGSQVGELAGRPFLCWEFCCPLHTTASTRSRSIRDCSTRGLLPALITLLCPALILRLCTTRGVVPADAMAGSDGGPAASPASRYELGELIGKGSFGTVHRG